MALLKKEHGIEVKSASSTIEEVVAREFVSKQARQRNIKIPSNASFADTPGPAKGGLKKPGGKAEPPKPAAQVMPAPRLVKSAKPASLRCYSITELVRLIERAGLRFVSATKGCSPEPFDATLPRMGGRVGLLAVRVARPGLPGVEGRPVGLGIAHDVERLGANEQVERERGADAPGASGDSDLHLSDHYAARRG